MAVCTVTAITGSSDFRRRRFLASTIKAQVLNGWAVKYLDDFAEVGSALAGEAFSGSEEEIPTLIVVEPPEKADFSVLAAYQKSGNKDKVVLLSYAGDPKKTTKLGKFLETLGKDHKQFVAPSEWKEIEEAISFCVSEAKTYDKQLSEELAVLIVARSGVDLGMLSFEIQKMAFLAVADGAKEISPVHIRNGLANLSRSHMQPLMESLTNRKASEVAKVLLRIEKSDKEPTMYVCRSIGKTISRWLAVKYLQEKGETPENIGTRLRLGGSNPSWFIKEKVFPQIKRWGVEDLKGLIGELASAERAVLNGHVQPWIGLVAGILRVVG
jgi:DNA polymerase III delta subunit